MNIRFVFVLMLIGDLYMLPMLYYAEKALLIADRFIAYTEGR